MKKWIESTSLKEWLIYLLPVIWLVLLAVSFVTAPDIDQFVREEGQAEAPEGFPSQIAEELIEEDDGFGGEEILLVYEQEDGFSSEQKEEIKEVLAGLSEEDHNLPIHAVTGPFDGDMEEERLISEDGDVLIALVEMDIEAHEYADIRNELQEASQAEGVDHDQTGEAVINEDVVVSTEEGLVTSTYITVSLVFLVLALVFKSLVSPLVPLLLLGTVYLFSISIVSRLIDWVGFPVSNFTQMFVLAVVFGVGTDYCILIMKRFQEEVLKDQTAFQAMLTTMRASKSTVLYSALTGFIGFATIYLADFDLYQSAVGVAVAVLVMMAGIWMVMPAVLALGGVRLFWPGKPGSSNPSNPLWGFIGGLTLRSPKLALVAVALLVIPFYLFYDDLRSFDNVQEIRGDYDSVKAYELTEEAFGQGDLFFSTLYLKTDEASWDDHGKIAHLEQLAMNIEKVEGIRGVRGLNRPDEDVPDEFRIPEQAGILSEGMVEALDGLDELSDGIHEMKDGLDDSEELLDEAEAGIGELIAGTEEIMAAVEEAEDQLDEAEAGIRNLMEGTEELGSGAKEIGEGIGEIRQGLEDAGRDVSSSREDLGLWQTRAEAVVSEIEAFERRGSELENEVQERAETVNNRYQAARREAEEALANAAEEKEQLRSELQEALNDLEAEAEGDLPSEELGRIRSLLDGHSVVPEDVTLPDLDLTALVPDLPIPPFSSYADEIRSALEDGDGQLQELEEGLTEAAEGLEEAEEGAGDLQVGLDDVQDGHQELLDGMAEARQGASDLSGGLDELQSGHYALLDGVGEGRNGLENFRKGLRDMLEGTEELNEGIGEAEDALRQVSKQEENPLEGLFIPNEAFEEEAFEEAFDQYVTPGGQVAGMELLFEEDPYSQEAMMILDEVEEVAAFTLRDTPFEDKEMAFSGITSSNRDLRDVSDQDFFVTAAVMLAGIFIALTFLFKSLIMPLYVLVSLVLTYIGSMAVAELIFVTILGYDGIMWAVPFFSFVLLMALGVDYSIFLMGRFREILEEGEEITIHDAIHIAMKRIGGTVISAALILGGTFAAMMASGVLTLMQVSTVIMTGLLLYTLVMLPVFVPACMLLLGSWNWWPLGRPKSERDS
ncbi:MMPL family transporter [Salisediminibacterium selenitireducens]|uniref:MMPL domain protein n=1 Tax=Bacillus selenitireducens (strain ATCC 700615 / DSM 15326 / MLS10) TaxID=439292 RepID=D6XWF7_BACIE|nr:MMPL family transporter [Salisediminibacterium selenitireducens]ADH97799.1 MMPL domain protein [[Bacillus] selenitireducens MLS10]